MEQITLYSEVRVSSEILETFLRKQGYIKPEQTVMGMNVKEELTVHLMQKRNVIPPVLTSDQEKLLEQKTLADFGLTPYQQKLFNGRSLREIINFPEEELMNFRYVKLPVINKLKKGLSDLGLSLAQLE